MKYQVMLTCQCRVWINVIADDPEKAKARALDTLYADDDDAPALQFTRDDTSPIDAEVLTVFQPDIGRKVWEKPRLHPDPDFN
jgi:hypothetical protein